MVGRSGLVGIETINPLNNTRSAIELLSQHNTRNVKVSKFTDVPGYRATPNCVTQAVAIKQKEKTANKTFGNLRQQRLSTRINRIKQLKLSEPATNTLCKSGKETLTLPPSCQKVESNKVVFENNEGVISEKSTSPKTNIIVSHENTDDIIRSKIKLKNPGPEPLIKRNKSLENYERELFLIRQRLEERFELENLDKDDQRRIDLEKKAAIIGPNAWHCTYDTTVKKTVFWCHRTKHIRLSAPKGWVKARRASIEKSQLKEADVGHVI